jgi:hypothetical protein
VDLPGTGVTLEQASGLPTEGRKSYWYETALPVTIRERVVIAVTEALKHEPDWERKVFGEASVGKWMSEVLGGANAMLSQDLTITSVDGQPDFTRQQVVTETLFQHVSLSEITTR